MKNLIPLLALLLPGVARSAILAIDSVSIAASEIQDVSGDIRSDATLNSFTVGSNTYTNFELISSIAGADTGNGGYLWAVNGTDPMSYEAAVLDNDPVTGGLNIGTAAFFNFGRVLGSDEVIFMLGNSSDSPGQITALDMSGSPIGTYTLTVVQSARLASADYQRSTLQANLDSRDIRGVTFTPGDFAGSGGDISTIYGFRIGNTNYDPNMVGIATVPEVSSLLFGLSGLLLLQRRRR